jgi:hypothetical protein
VVGSGCPDPPTGSDNSQFGGDETQIDLASEQHVLNLATAAPHPLVIDHASMIDLTKKDDPCL